MDYKWYINFDFAQRTSILSFRKGNIVDFKQHYQIYAKILKNVCNLEKTWVEENSIRNNMNDKKEL